MKDYYVDFCKRYGIEVVSMWGEWATEDICNLYNRNGIKVFTHTINSVVEAQTGFENGVSGFYTDYLLPKDER